MLRGFYIVNQIRRVKPSVLWKSFTTVVEENSKQVINKIEESSVSKNIIIENQAKNAIPQIDKKVKSKKRKTILLWSTAIVGCAGLGAGIHKYYEDELLDYLKITAHPSILTKSLMKVHIIPPSLPDYSDYSYPLFCERFAHYLYEYNPFHWKNMGDAFEYFSTWFDISSLQSKDNLSEQALEHFFLHIDNPSKLFVIGMKVFDVYPMSSALLSECIAYFKNAKYSTIRNNREILVYLKKEDIVELVKKIEIHFNTRLEQFSSTGEMTIETKIKQYNDAFSLYDFIDILSNIAYQLQHDNQLLLFIHNELVEMQTKEGMLRLEEKRRKEKEDILEHERNAAKEVLEEQCKHFSAFDDSISYLIKQRFDLTVKYVRECIGLEYRDDITSILLDLIDGILYSKEWW